MLSKSGLCCILPICFFVTALNLNPLNWLGNKLALYLQKPNSSYRSETTCDPVSLLSTLKKGDVLLVDGDSRVSAAIKYLSQSTWSHAALCISDQQDASSPNSDEVLLLEADVVEGVRVIPLSIYVKQGTRICRPVGLKPEDIEIVCGYGKTKIGHQYDTKNVVDLARFLIQTPPVPVGWRRQMLTLGSGDPTQAICSSLVAQCFQSVQYPILPDKRYMQKESIFQSRHHSLFVPRDFDLSPYFQVIKPTIDQHFDPYQITWDDSHDDKQLTE